MYATIQKKKLVTNWQGFVVQSLLLCIELVWINSSKLLCSELPSLLYVSVELSEVLMERPKSYPREHKLCAFFQNTKKERRNPCLCRESNGHFLFCLFTSVSLSMPTLHSPLFLSPPLCLRQCDFVLFHVQRSPLQYYCRQLNSQKWSKQKIKCTEEQK